MEDTHAELRGEKREEEQHSISSVSRGGGGSGNDDAQQARADEKEPGIKVLNDAIEAVRKKIEAAGGKLNVKEAPRTVSERDERMLADKMAAISRMEDEDEDEDSDESDSDSDSDEEEDGGMGKLSEGGLSADAL